jgi:hypothetical protein
MKADLPAVSWQLLTSALGAHKQITFSLPQETRSATMLRRNHREQF